MPAGIAVVGYLVNILVPLIESLEFTKYISILHYYIGDKPFINGITPWHAVVLIAIAVISFAIGMYRFDRRDLS